MAYGEQCRIRDLQRFSFSGLWDQRPDLTTQGSCVTEVSLQCKGTEKASYIDIRRGWGVPRSLVLASVSKRVMYFFNSVQFSSVPQSCLTPCNPVYCSMPGLPVHHQLPEFTQTYVH